MSAKYLTNCSWTEEPSVVRLKRKAGNGSEQNSVNLGTLHLEVSYEDEQLTVFVDKAQNLPKMDVIGWCDPYCYVYLTRDMSATVLKQKNKDKTKIHGDDPNPVFLEEFIFTKISSQSLRNLRLVVTVWDKDSIGKDDFIGGVRISLKELLGVNTSRVKVSMPLQAVDTDGHPLELDLEPSWCEILDN